MDKYLNDIKSYLYVLDEEIIVIEINNIRNYLNESLSSGKKFEELNLVSAKEQASEILKSHGINPDLVLKKENIFKRKGKELSSALNHLLDIMSKNDIKSNLKIVLDILILLVFISLIKIPFIAVRNIGESLLQNIDFPIAFDIWGIAIEIVYVIVAIMVFINVFPRWFKNLKPSGKKKVFKKEVVVETKKMGNDLESISLTNNEKE